MLTKKYYLSDQAIQGRLKTNYQKYKLDENLVNDKDVHPTILARFEGAPTLLKVKEATKKGYAEAFEGDSVNLEQPNSKTRRGRVGKQVAQTLTTSCNQGVVVNDDPKIEVVGNYHKSNHNASRIVSADGLAPTVKENHGTVTGVVISQTVEVSDREHSNAVSTVQKDSLVAEQSHWIDEAGDFRCSKCGEFQEYVSKFCPECGARMVLENER